MESKGWDSREVNGEDGKVGVGSWVCDKRGSTAGRSR